MKSAEYLQQMNTYVRCFFVIKGPIFVFISFSVDLDTVPICSTERVFEAKVLFKSLKMYEFKGATTSK